MNDVAHMIMTSDNARNTWLIDFYLKNKKCYAWRSHSENFMAGIKISLSKNQKSVKEMVSDLFPGKLHLTSNKMIITFSLFYMDLSVEFHLYFF